MDINAQLRAVQLHSKQILATCPIKRCQEGIISCVFDCDHCAPLFREQQEFILNLECDAVWKLQHPNA